MSITPSQTLREVIRSIIIDPARLEFGETQVNLRVGGTVDRIMNEIETYLDEQQLPKMMNGGKKVRNKDNTYGLKPALSVSDIGYNQAIAEQLAKNKEGLRWATTYSRQT